MALGTATWPGFTPLHGRILHRRWQRSGARKTTLSLAFQREKWSSARSRPDRRSEGRLLAPFGTWHRLLQQRNAAPDQGHQNGREGNKHKPGHEAVFRHVVSCVRMRKTLSFLIGSAAIAEQAIGPPMGSHSALVMHSHQEIPIPKMCSNRTLYGQICGAMRQRLTANQPSSRNVSLLPAELTFS
jgi:hypothetical protein